MGLREKVALVAIAVIFQIAYYANCKPQSLKENPFERFVGCRKHGKNAVMNSNNSVKRQHYYYNAPGEANTCPSIFKSVEFPGVCSTLNIQTKPSSFEASSASALNKKYNPALLESYKKEARRKRKSKKQVAENVTPKSTLSLDIQPVLTEIGTFPEVEYPLSAMDTWAPKYWNSVLYNMDEPYIKPNNFDHLSPFIKPVNSNIYQKSSSMKGNKGTFSVKNPTETKNIAVQNIETLKQNGVKNSITETPFKKELKVNNQFFSPNRNIRRKSEKYVKMTKPLKPHSRSNKLLAKESTNLNNSTSLLEKFDNSTLRYFEEVSKKSQNTNTTSTITYNNAILDNLNQSSLSISSKQDELESPPQSKLNSGECPVDVICESHTVNNGADTIKSNINHESLIDPQIVFELQQPDYYNSFDDTIDFTKPRVDNFSVQTNTQLENNGEEIISSSNLPVAHETFDVAEPDVVKESDRMQVAKLNPIGLRDFAEQVLAQIGPVPEEYSLPTNYVLPQSYTSQIILDYDMSADKILDLLKRFITTQNSNKKNRNEQNLFNLVKLYNLVVNVLSAINSQKKIPSDALVEIITGIDSLPIDYTATDTSITDKITDTHKILPTEYIIPDSMTTNYEMNEKLQQMTIIDDKSKTVQHDPRTEKAIKNSQNDSFSFCPVTTIDEFSIDNHPELNASNNITSIPTTLTGIENGSTVERIIEDTSNETRKRQPLIDKENIHEKDIVSIKDIQLVDDGNHMISNLNTLADMTKKKLMEHHSISNGIFKDTTSIEISPSILDNNTSVILGYFKYTPGNVTNYNVQDTSQSSDEIIVSSNELASEGIIVSSGINTITDNIMQENLPSSEDFPRNDVLSFDNTSTVSNQKNLQPEPLANNEIQISSDNKSLSSAYDDKIIFKISASNMDVLSETPFTINLPQSSVDNDLPETVAFDDKAEARNYDTKQKVNLTENGILVSPNINKFLKERASDIKLTAPEPDVLRTLLTSKNTSESHETNVFPEFITSDTAPVSNDADILPESCVFDDALVLAETLTIKNVSGMPDVKIEATPIHDNTSSLHNIDVLTETAANEYMPLLTDAEGLIEAQPFNDKISTPRYIDMPPDITSNDDDPAFSDANILSKKLIPDDLISSEIDILPDSREVSSNAYGLLSETLVPEFIPASANVDITQKVNNMSISFGTDFLSENLSTDEISTTPFTEMQPDINTTDHIPPSFTNDEVDVTDDNLVPSDSPKTLKTDGTALNSVINTEFIYL